MRRIFLLFFKKKSICYSYIYLAGKTTLFLMIVLLLGELERERKLEIKELFKKVSISRNEKIKISFFPQKS
jgi:hypothetical protein